MIKDTNRVLSKREKEIDAIERYHDEWEQDRDQWYWEKGINLDPSFDN